MATESAYSLLTDVRFRPLELIDIRKLHETCQEAWFNQTLCQVNDCVVRLGVVQGEFHWHKHDDEDEFFYVVEGQFLIDLEDHTVEPMPQQGFTVPKGVLHRTRAPERTVILMIEVAPSRRQETDASERVAAAPGYLARGECETRHARLTMAC